MDFGSAADLDTIGPGPFAKKIGLMDQRVAISPIYAAPELFINADAGGGQYAKDVACTFDCFSAGLLFCQLLFQYLDELTDTGFRQQLESAANWNLNIWLQAELASKFRQRNSLQNALQVLAERPGLWSLLQDLLQADPRDRCSSKQALKRWKEIRSKLAAQRTTRREAATTVEDENYVDGAYLQEVLQSMDICIIPEDEITTTTNVVSTVSAIVSTTPATLSASSSAPTPLRTYTELLVLNSRPLQYVATFRRKQSLGLLLAEAFDEENKASPDIMEEMKHESHRTYWQHVIVPQARPGEVYIYGIVPLGQADEMDIFEVGVRFLLRLSMLLPMLRCYGCVCHAANGP
jgi:serine/threonine protein kinase